MRTSIAQLRECSLAVRIRITAHPVDAAVDGPLAGFDGATTQSVGRVAATWRLTIAMQAGPMNDAREP